LSSCSRIGDPIAVGFTSPPVRDPVLVILNTLSLTGCAATTTIVVVKRLRARPRVMSAPTQPSFVRG
jgi:hypothetical protein